MTVMLYPHVSAPSLPAETMTALQDYADAMHRALPTLDVRRFPTTERHQRQIRIMDAAIGMAGDVVAAGRCTLAKLQAYVDAVMPDIADNVMDAGRVQVKGYAHS